MGRRLVLAALVALAALSATACTVSTTDDWNLREVEEGREKAALRAVDGGSPDAD
jgi:hypothetical protein